MKKNLWIVFAVAISTSLFAQDASNSAPVLQAPPPEPTPMTAPPTTTPVVEPTPTVEASTNAPAAPKKGKTAKKKTTKKTATAAHKAKPAGSEMKSVPLVPGPAVVSANHVNVRSKAGLVGEVISHMTNGESVTVIEEVHLKKSGPDEPSAWAKVLLPADTHVWVKSSLLDSNNAVASKKINLRAGPGENYGVVGMAERGETVQTIDTKGDWTQIQAPTNAYAYMAAVYLKQGGEEAPTVASTPTPEPTPTPTPMPDMPGMAPATGATPGAMDTNAPGTMAQMPTPTPDMPAAAPVAQEPPPQRIVDHEGLVRGSFSIQAPTRYQLISQDTHQPIDYLYTTSTNLDLSRYKGMHIIVTGEEALDPRWGNTPVMTIQKIKVLD